MCKHTLSKSYTLQSLGEWLCTNSWLHVCYRNNSILSFEILTLTYKNPPGTINFVWMGMELGLWHERKNVTEGVWVLLWLFGPKREKTVWGLIKLQSKMLHNLYSSPSIIRMIKLWRMRWVRHMACMREMRNVYGVLTTKPEGKIRLGRPGCRWKNNITMKLKGIRWERLD